jgi:hypothetical protein
MRSGLQFTMGIGYVIAVGDTQTAAEEIADRYVQDTLVILK